MYKATFLYNTQKYFISPFQEKVVNNRYENVCKYLKTMLMIQQYFEKFQENS